MDQPEIVMYVRQNCGDVHYARRVLTERDVDWTEVDIDRDEDGLRKVIAWNDGRSPTPTLWIGKTMLVEPDRAAIDAALEAESGTSISPAS